jgi:uncharacterized membrane protein
MDRIKSLLGNKLVIRSAIVLAIAVAGINLPAEQVDMFTNVLVSVLSLFG